MGIERRWIDGAAVALAAAGVAIGVLTPAVARMDSGVRLGVDAAAARIVVAWVEPYSPAAEQGIEAGMVATMVNDQLVLRLPAMVYPEPAPGVTPDPWTGEFPQPSPVVEPLVPTPVTTDPDVLGAIAAQPVRSLEATWPSSLDALDPGQGIDWIEARAFGDDGRNRLRESILGVVFGIGLLFGTAWLLLTGRAGRDLEELGVPLAVATAAPYLLLPLAQLWHPVALAAHAVLVPLSLVPLGVALLGRIEADTDRRVAAAAVAVCAAGGGVAALARELNPVLSGVSWDAGMAAAPTLLAAGVTLVPGIVAAGPAVPGSDALASRRVLRSAELALVGATPAVALLTAGSPVAWAFLLWVAAIAVAGRFTVRPLARLASRAQLQRDLVVAATEAERARVAADIHDDALQELTLLVRRLDTAGDTEGAEIARTVSDRLRAICGDLRLPILDDLGVGPALDWLVLRIERLAGGEVRLERNDGSRPPAEVELAFFRVAQEALANAVKHGSPPIAVRYRATAGAASLSIDDAGAGIPADAGDRAEREGHFGLLNMHQRAEAIGAILDVRRWPAGGTHVQLEWRAR